MTCKNTVEALKNRLSFATQRWGGSGVLFAWDLWNEVEPIHANNEVEAIAEFVSGISTFLRDLEIRIHGKTHLQTVSAFAPHLNKYPLLKEVIFRHPHVLTRGMQLAQKSLAAFCRLVDWKVFNRQNIAGSIKVNSGNIKVFACGDGNQMIIWLLRTKADNKHEHIHKLASPIEVTHRCRQIKATIILPSGIRRPLMFNIPALVSRMKKVIFL